MRPVSKGNKQPLEQPYGQGCQGYDTETLGEYLGAFLAVAMTKGLCRHTTCADPQETEVPVQQVEQHRTDRDTAYRRCIGYMSYNRHIHQSHQGDGDIRQDTRQGQVEDTLIQIEN